MFHTLTSDPDVVRYLSWFPHSDVEVSRRVLVEEFNAGDDPTWVIELKNTGELVGTCGWVRRVPHAVDLGYCLGRRWRRQGIMSEVAQVMIDEAQRDRAVYRVSAYCHPDNAASAGVMRHCGLNFEGRLTRYAVFPNLGPEPQDVWMFAKAVQ